MYAQSDPELENIQQILATMPDSTRLSYLDARMTENEQNMLRADYARLLYAESLRQKNDTYKANAVYMLARHFYVVNTDSMRVWVKIAEPLFQKTGRLEDLFRIKAWDIYLLGYENQKAEVINAVNELKQLSNTLNYPEGIEMADQALANFYMENELPEEGEAIYLRVLDQMEKRDAPLIKRFNIIRHLFNSKLESRKRIAYLEKAEAMLNECQRQGLTMIGADNPIYALEYIIHRNYASEYAETNEHLDKAWLHLQKADSIATKYQMVRSEGELTELYHKYYFAAGEYEKSLTYVEKIIETYKARKRATSMPQYYIAKARALSFLNRYKEAYETMSETLVLKDSIFQTDFYETMAAMRTQYEVDKLELDNQLIEEKANKSRLQMLVLVVGCVILIFIIIGLMYLIRTIQRNRKVLEEAKNKAEDADRMKSAFLANMNHEIRTPLNAIVGFSQVLVDEEDREQREEFAKIIENNNELLQQLIGDVLDISKIESNSMTLFYKEYDLALLMKDVYNSLRLRVSEEVKFILEPCVPLLIETDRSRLIQVISNLLTNAIKHTSSGFISFGYEPKGTSVCFYVKDTGEGISDELKETIFDRFVQLANGRKGVGLGLAICKGIVTQMGGKIWVESELGKGSAFMFEVPVKQT